MGSNPLGKVKYPKENGKASVQVLTPSADPKTDSLAIDTDGTYSTTIHLTEPGYYRVISMINSLSTSY
ncbi:MAG: hypothetical protein WDO15_17315 [Bacteroidota bacterium]